MYRTRDTEMRIGRFTYTTAVAAIAVAVATGCTSGGEENIANTGATGTRAATHVVVPPPSNTVTSSVGRPPSTCLAPKGWLQQRSTDRYTIAFEGTVYCQDINDSAWLILVRDGRAYSVAELRLDSQFQTFSVETRTEDLPIGGIGGAYFGLVVIKGAEAAAAMARFQQGGFDRSALTPELGQLLVQVKDSATGYPAVVHIP